MTAYSATTGSAVYGGRFAPVPQLRTVTADGIHTWFTDHPHSVVNGHLISNETDSVGSCWAYRTSLTTHVTQSFLLGAIGEIDDHNQGGHCLLFDGRITFTFGPHNDSQFKYRTWNGVGDFTNPANWTNTKGRGDGEGSYSYPSLFRLSQDTSRLFFFSRRWADGGGVTRNLSLRTVSSIAQDNVTSDPWSAYTDILTLSGQRPYVKRYSNGVDRIDYTCSSTHPAEASFNTVHHFYCKLDGSNVLRWYTRSGASDVELTTPFSPNDCQRIDDGGSIKRWVSDITVASNGRPRVLWLRYPNGDGSLIEYWSSTQQTDGTWIVAKVVDGGPGNDSTEPFYHAGLCYDNNNADRIFLIAPVLSLYQEQEWAVLSNGASFTKIGDRTTGAYTGKRLRVSSPRNHGGLIRSVHAVGTYNHFQSYNTSVVGFW